MRIWIVLLCAPLLLAGVPGTARAETAACVIPEEFTTPTEPLERVRAAIKSGGPVNILALGSATTVEQEPGTGTPFPFRMAEALHAANPKVAFQVTVKGSRGLMAVDMLPLLDQALKSTHFQLVLWQTGTVEAVRGMRPEDLLQALQDGTDRINSAGADLILIDPQYSRFLRTNANLDPYEQSLQQIAALPNVLLFHRFELMHTWSNEGQIDLERTPPRDRLRAMDTLRRCVGEALARLVQNATELPER